MGDWVGVVVTVAEAVGDTVIGGKPARAGSTRNAKMNSRNAVIIAPAQDGPGRTLLSLFMTPSPSFLGRLRLEDLSPETANGLPLGEPLDVGRMRCITTRWVT